MCLDILQLTCSVIISTLTRIPKLSVCVPIFFLILCCQSIMSRCYYNVCICCVIGEAMERCYGGCLCYGPPTEGGFYYDMFYDQGSVIDSFITIRIICNVV